MTSISVVIPAYNYGEYIDSAIQSVLPQLLPDDECVVVDDGSTDNTASVLASYIKNSQISYIKQANLGVSAARNHGISAAKNEWLYFLDADDECLPGGLASLRKAAMINQDAAMIIATHQSVDNKGRKRVSRRQNISENFEKNFRNYVARKKITIANGGEVLIRRAVVSELKYPESLRVSEDFCVYAWIFATRKCVSIPDCVVSVRKHQGSLRHRLGLYEDAVSILPDIVFDASKIPEKFFIYRKIFRCNRLLSLFRAYYLAGDIKAAKKTYVCAIKCRPLNVLKLSYLRKYMYALAGRSR